MHRRCSMWACYVPVVQASGPGVHNMALVAIKSTGRTPPHQTCVTMKTCVMTSHVCHSGQGSVISCYDCVISGNIGDTGSFKLLHLLFSRKVDTLLWLQSYDSYPIIFCSTNNFGPYTLSFWCCCKLCA